MSCNNPKVSLSALSNQSPKMLFLKHRTSLNKRTNMQLNYKEQLADSRWLQKKAEILIRDNYTCQKCGAKSHLNVHHLSYENGKLAWEYPNEQLITLCKDCHENEHDVVPNPIVGKFYTYHHSDYTNDMLCYHIDNRNELVYLFGVDSGNFGGGYIDVFNLNTFKSKCRNSDFLAFANPNDYTYQSFNIAYTNLLVDFAYADGTATYSKEQIIEFAKVQVAKLYNKIFNKE